MATRYRSEINEIINRIKINAKIKGLSFALGTAEQNLGELEKYVQQTPIKNRDLYWLAKIFEEAEPIERKIGLRTQLRTIAIASGLPVEKYDPETERLTDWLKPHLDDYPAGEEPVEEESPQAPDLSNSSRQANDDANTPEETATASRASEPQFQEVPIPFHIKLQLHDFGKEKELRSTLQPLIEAELSSFIYRHTGYETRVENVFVHQGSIIVIMTLVVLGFRAVNTSIAGVGSTIENFQFFSDLIESFLYTSVSAPVAYAAVSSSMVSPTATVTKKKPDRGQVWRGEKLKTRSVVATLVVLIAVIIAMGTVGRYELKSVQDKSKEVVRLHTELEKKIERIDGQLAVYQRLIPDIFIRIQQQAGRPVSPGSKKQSPAE